MEPADTTQAGLGATVAAREAITALRAAHGPLLFVLSAGCCGGTAPMCFPAGDYLVGANEQLLGEVEGCPFVMDARHFAAWCEPVLLLDVQEGFAEGFSLPAGEGLHFVIRSPAPAPD